jgi:hypothetical protein
MVGQFSFAPLASGQGAKHRHMALSSYDRSDYEKMISFESKRCLLFKREQQDHYICRNPFKGLYCEKMENCVYRTIVGVGLFFIRGLLYGTNLNS